jgi:hypothetical protein
MDIGKAITFPSDDEKWFTKLIIGALVAAIPIVNFAWMGYMVDILRNVMAGYAKPLPEWDDFGQKFIEGLLLWLATIIYGIPVFIFGCISVGLIVGSGVAVDSLEFQDAAGVLFSGIGIVSICMMLLILLYSLLVSFYFPAVAINFARKGNFGSCFEFGEIFGIVSTNLGKYITAWLVAIVAFVILNFVVGLVASALWIVICIGWIIAWIFSAIANVWISTVGAHLFGQYGAAQAAEVVD